MHENYRQYIEKIYQLLKACPDPSKKGNGEGWSVAQVLGHLLDSAGNNHQRFARYNAQGHFAFPGYDQEVFVQRARYDAFDFQTLLALWYQYNQLLLHIIEHIPQDELSMSTITVGERPSVTLEQLVEDYFAHMEVHERQIREILGV
ncbi:MAG: DinB family protein [Anaerolineae bacterium]|nr:DinB family protein [Anaerolineae bacterium]